jgi:hypothetical protein
MQGPLPSDRPYFCQLRILRFDDPHLCVGGNGLTVCREERVKVDNERSKLCSFLGGRR